MNLQARILATLAVAVVAVPACAASLLMEGRGVATNRAGLRTSFHFNVRKDDSNPPVGRFEAGWSRGDARISVSTENVRYAAVVRNFGRFSGPGVLKVTTTQGVREVEGVVYVSMWDNAPGGSGPDKIRIRFIRDPFGSPEHDHYFEGLVVDGNLVVRSR